LGIRKIVPVNQKLLSSYLYLKQVKLRYIFLHLMFIFISYSGFCQLYYVSSASQLIELNITGTSCSSSVVGPFVNSATGSNVSAGDIAVCPNGKLYINTNQYTYEVNPLTASCTLVASPSSNLVISALGCSPNNELYGVGFVPLPGSVYEIDVAAGSTTLVGTMPFTPSGDLVFWGGNAYMSSTSGIVKVNIGNPAASTLMFSSPSYTGLTILASDCNALLGGSGTQLTKIDLITGGLTPFCGISQTVGGLTTPSEFTTPPDCPFEIDLDKNDSSGAIDFDFNGPKIDCINGREKPIADIDAKIICSKSINTINITIGAGLQTPGLEFLSLLSSIPNISVTGNGSTSITLTNTGNASTINFENALKAIKYINNADPLVPGIREIIVQGFDILGDPSNVAKAYIEVIFLPTIQLELGDDIEKCPNETIAISANLSNVNYGWSNGETTQTIQVTAPGTYRLTVTNGIECPDIDSVKVIDNPTYIVYLSGGGVICSSEQALITVNTTYSGLIDISTINQNGMAFNLNGIANGFTFVVPSVDGSYTIFNSNSSIGAQCLENSTGAVNVVIGSNYTMTQNVPLCNGDSILIDNQWIKNTSTIVENLQTLIGCDSIVTTFVEVLTFDSTFIILPTCDLLNTGVTYEQLKNMYNCDSIIVKNFVYVPPEITYVYSTTCQLNLVGISSESYINQFGCDSVVVTNLSYLASDSTFITKKTCDANKAGLFIQELKSYEGCDSIVSTIVKYIKSDSTFINKKTCDIKIAGTFIQALQSSEGCDSIVSTNIKYVKSDSTFISKKTCDITIAGTFIQALQSSEGCDSIVLTVVNYVKVDSTFIAKKTCDITKAGTFIQALQSFQGCDSIVFTNVKYVKSDSTFIAKKTCDITKAGTFIQALQSYEGCDSIVLTNIKYVKSDSTFIAKKTCDITKEGIFIQALQSYEGCDSIVLTNIKYVKSDSTFIAKKTCNIDKAGTFIQALQSYEGCDSIVSTNVKYVKADSTYIAKKTCDVNKAGLFIQALQSFEGCDSIVLTNVKYVKADSTYIAKKTCDVNKAGLFIQALQSFEGCDSIVLTNVKYVKADSTFIAKKTCDVSKAGLFIQALQSSEGCDSIILTSVQFIPSDTVEVLKTTCIESESGYESMKLVNKNGCDSIVNIDVKYVGSLVKRFEKYTCIEAEVGALPYTFTNVNGCDSIIYIDVKLLPIDSCGKKIEYYFSNILMINGGGSNNTFTVYSNQDNVVVESIDIYDRWGNKVFGQSKFPTNNRDYGWNGTMNNNALISGVYVYHCKVVEGNGFKDIVGTVTVIE
jgi:gliding motility-associated-like protein